MVKDQKNFILLLYFLTIISNAQSIYNRYKFLVHICFFILLIDFEIGFLSLLKTLFYVYNSKRCNTNIPLHH